MATTKRTRPAGLSPRMREGQTRADLPLVLESVSVEVVEVPTPGEFTRKYPGSVETYQLRLISTDEFEGCPEGYEQRTLTYYVRTDAHPASKFEWLRQMAECDLDDVASAPKGGRLVDIE